VTRIMQLSSQTTVSRHDRTTSNSSWIALLVAAVAIVGVGMIYLNTFTVASRRESRDGSKSDRVSKNKDATTIAPIVSKEGRRFLWDPTTLHQEKSKEASKPKKVLPVDEQNKQIELLASMTFANGGFRGPSCPCCQ
jgi:Flp pilus assembly protein TadB